MKKTLNKCNAQADTLAVESELFITRREPIPPKDYEVEEKTM